MPIYCFDFKYTEPNDSLVSVILPTAVKAGYKIHVFALGMDESEICNPLDFLIDDMDGMAARQLASIMHKCMRSEHRDASDDPFFSVAGDLLIQAVLLLAKQTKFPDMMMCQVILTMTDLPKRIQASKLSKLTKNTFSQYLSVSRSEKTADSIRGTAQNLFVPFTTPGLANAFCGKTTLPLTLEGKTLVVVGMDKSVKTALAPFLSGIMQMVLDRNVAIAKIVLRQYQVNLANQRQTQIISSQATGHVPRSIVNSDNNSANLPVPKPAEPVEVEPLTKREVQVLELMAEGLSNPQIGHKLYISAGTVKSHVGNILRKLSADTRTEATSRALKSQLFERYQQSAKHSS